MATRVAPPPNRLASVRKLRAFQYAIALAYTLEFVKWKRRRVVGLFDGVAASLPRQMAA
jgi:hypothetical protein